MYKTRKGINTMLDLILLIAYKREIYRAPSYSQSVIENFDDAVTPETTHMSSVSALCDLTSSKQLPYH